MRRRTYLQTLGASAVAGLLAGCAGDSDGGESNRGENEVIAGQGGNLTFTPERLTISTGETVTWTFESARHNVECNPAANDQSSLPDGAEPFASFEGDNRFATVATGESYEHTFDVAGTYEYICVPHATQGMTGTIVVEE